MSEVTLAVGDGVCRMTYAELAEARSISITAARRLTLRHRWAKQTGNDGLVRVSVPLSALAKSRKIAGAGKGATDTGQDPALDALSDSTRALRALERAVDTLREQLTIANQRAERAERCIDELQTTLEAKTQELSALLAEQNAPHRRKWWPWSRG